MTRLPNLFPYTKAKEEQSKRLTKGEKKSNQENNISKLWGPVRHLNSNRSIRARGLHQQAREKGRRASEQPINKVLRLAHLLITPLCRSSKDSRSPTHAMGCSAECSKVSSLLFHGFESWLAGETNRGTDSGFVVTCLTNSKARVMMTCLQLFGRDDNNGLA